MLCAVVEKFCRIVGIDVIDILAIRKVGIAFIVAPGVIMDVIGLIVGVFDHDNGSTQTL